MGFGLGNVSKTIGSTLSGITGNSSNGKSGAISGNLLGKFSGGGDKTDQVISDGKFSQDEINNYLSDSKNGASSLLAAISRLEWKDFQDRYAPVMQTFADQVMSGDTVTDAVNDARSSTIQGFTNAQKNQGLADARFGVKLNDGALAARERSNNLASVAAQVSTVNDARVSAKDRENIILSGGAGAGLKTGG